MTILVYGATGYTGTLIAETCARRRVPATLAGRTEAPLRALAERVGLPFVVAGLDDASALDGALGACDAVLHCAGPFSRTAAPMVDACLRCGKHYLDITGEIGVFEALARRSDEAAARGVMLLPGVGFDVVPSDCLAAHLKRRMPSAVRLRLCIASLGALSHGTATTMVEHFAAGGAIRKNGVIVSEPAAARRRTFEVRGKNRDAVSMPWGDVATAWRSTGIPDIEVYFALPARVRRMLQLANLAGALLRSARVRRLMQSFIPPGGPSVEQRARAQSVLVGEVEDEAGAFASSRFTGPDGYNLTVETALLCVTRAARGDAKPGYQTPATAYGPDFVLDVPGTARVDT